MRTASLIAALSLAATFAAAPAGAQEFTGTWELTVETPRGSQTMTLVLVQDGDELTGTITPSFGGGGPGGRGGRGGGDRQPPEIEIEDGTVDGASFSFSMTMGFGDRSFSQAFSGALVDGEMKGTIAGGRGERSFTGKRKE